MAEIKKIQLEVTRNELVLIHHGLTKVVRLYKVLNDALTPAETEAGVKWPEDIAAKMLERVERILQEIPYEGYT